MKGIIKKAFEFIRQNPEILYSLAVIIIIPLVLYFNTFFIIQRFRETIETDIQSQAVTTKEPLGALLARDFSSKDSLNREMLQQTIDNITSNINSDDNKLVENMRVVIKDGDKYKAIAAQNHSDVDKIINTDPSLNGESLVVYSWSTATDIQGPIMENKKNYWRFIKPLLDQNSKEVYGLVVFDISQERINNSIAAAVWWAFAVLALVIILSLFLTFQHTRLFSYVSLSKDLQAKNKAKDDFIRMATHELRSPVTVINMSIETLKEDLVAVANDEQKRLIEHALISIRNLRDLMADILEVSHIQQGRTDFNPVKIVPADVIKEIVEGVSKKAEEKKLALVFESENFPCSIDVNPVCFKRIITNLVENSIKYTPAGKITVSIKAETSKKRCVIIVQDTGFGISAEGQKRLFEQFYRVKTRETEEIPGTGLGLWMSREMARKMGGDIMLESIEHMGSRFFVFFPLSGK